MPPSGSASGSGYTFQIEFSRNLFIVSFAYILNGKCYNCSLKAPGFFLEITQKL